MKIEKFSQLLALVAWANVLVVSWLLILRNIPAEASTFVPYGVFVVIAVMASAVASPRRNVSKATITKNEGSEK